MMWWLHDMRPLEDRYWWVKDVESDPENMAGHGVDCPVCGEPGLYGLSFTNHLSEEHGIKE